MCNDFLHKASKIIIIERDYQTKNKKKLYDFFDYKIMPAIVAVSHDANAPPNIAFVTSFARSLLRPGAIPPIPPSCIPIEPKFAKPHNA